MPINTGRRRRQKWELLGAGLPTAEGAEIMFEKTLRGLDASNLEG